MKTYFILLPLLFIMANCRSVPEKVKANKEIFIEIAKGYTATVDINNLTDLYDQAKTNNTEEKMEYLGVNDFKIIYGTNNNDGTSVDSIVIFTKSNYKIVYDFAVVDRGIEAVRQCCNLKNFEKIDDRLYIGQE